MPFLSDGGERSVEIARADKRIARLTRAAGGPTPPSLEVAIDREMRLRDYWAMVRNHLWLVVGITVIIPTPVAYVMLRSPDYYEAKARVELNNKERPGAVSGEPRDISPIVTDPTFVNTQLQVMKSPALLRRVVRALDLEHNKAFLRRMAGGGRLTRKLLRLTYFGLKDDLSVSADQVPLTTTLSPSVSLQEFAEAQRLAPYVADVQGRLTVAPVMQLGTVFRDTRLVDLTWRHPNPQLAATVINAIVDAFVSENLKKNTEGSLSANAYLTQRTEELQAQIREAEEALIRYAKSNEILSLEPGQNVAVERLTTLNRRLLEAENDRKQAEANYHAAQAPGAAGALAEERARTVIDQAEIRLADLRARRAQMLVGATQLWPEVQEINQQILAEEREVQNSRTQAIARTLASLETKYKQASALEQTLRADFTAQRRLIQVQNEAAVNYRLIQQEIETHKSLLNQLLKQLGENDLARAAQENNFRVMDYAVTPDPREPAGPWRLLYIGAACVFALMLGVGVAIGREFMDETLRSSYDVQEALQLPTIGVIRSTTRQPLLLSSSPGQGTGLLRLGHVGSIARRSDRPESVIGSSVPGDFAEDYRRLRTSVLLPMTDDSPRELLVTSSQAGEGRTTTAVNIASSLAQTGARVLVIDADMRRPMVHAFFGLDNSRGLSTILSAAPVPDVLDTIHWHEPSGVHVLPGGPVPQNPAELLGSEPMIRLLAMLRRSFTYIVIDSPPITSYTDSVMLASMVDAVLLVVRASKTSRETVRDSQELLVRAGARFLGVVLNGVTRSDPPSRTSRVSGNDV